MKKALSLILAGIMLLLAAAALAEESEKAEKKESLWIREERERLTVGNPTPVTGHFFTDLWGGTTSDLDVQALLHAYSPVCWDGSIAHYRFDRSVVEGAAAQDDTQGNRSYYIVLYDDLFYSDGTPITAYDYAFSVLFQMDSAIAETGGIPADFSWIAGSDEYLSGEASTLTGFRIMSDQIMQITAKAEALPYFYELNRLDIKPYPAREIAPGITVADDGEGIYLSEQLTAEMIQRTVLDGETGYMSHPTVVSGPYMLTGFDGTISHFQINSYYKGNERGVQPRIGELSYVQADNADMIKRLSDGEIGLLNKVTADAPITAGYQLDTSHPDQFAFTAYPRTGLTMIWFMESSEAAQDFTVRKAIAYCLDRDGFTSAYTGGFGIRVDGFYGISQWMYQIATGAISSPDTDSFEEGAEEPEEYDWEGISLEGLTLYETDPEFAKQLLDEGGWNLNAEGNAYSADPGSARYRKNGDSLTGLNLTMGIPDDDRTEQAIRDWFLPNLEEAGIIVTLKRMDMADLVKAYRGESDGGTDMIYMGENFSVVLTADILEPDGETDNYTGNLTQAKQEVYQKIEEMVRTEPKDIPGFVKKWVTVQETITKTLPLIPVYSNVYFDFFTRELHEYEIAGHITWADAIVESYMSDIEELQKDEQAEPLQLVEKIRNKYGIHPK